MTALGLTRRQAECLRYIGRHWQQFGVSPSYAEIADGMDAKSKGHICAIVGHLASRGYITLAAYRPRTIRPTPEGAAYLAEFQSDAAPE